ncbi:hypothetical protein [Pseudoalteromonas aurantia]|uniref:hypothetical protein n=1 Tax=Pseudoalteromonas aurantia TaxID=43654 RepID=UPI00110A3927|nr:hypothetical protein [Pseudoalteromonas aurantia]
MKNYLPEFLGVALAFLLLNLWYLSGIAIEEGVVPKHYDHIIRIVTVSTSALVGAFAAFLFNDHLTHAKEKREKETLVADKVAVLNKALLNIALQLNAIGNIEKLLSRFTNEHELAFKMPAEKNFNENIFIDVNEIAVILTDYPQLLMEISVQQDGFIQTVESLKIRHEFYLKDLQPKMYELGILDRKFTVGEYEAALPYYLFKGAYDSVLVLQKNVKSSSEGLEKRFSDLRSACKELYPGHRFMNLKS